jgi:hypothetical protein
VPNHHVKVVIANNMPLEGAEVNHNTGYCTTYRQSLGLGPCDDATEALLTNHEGIATFVMGTAGPHMFRVTHSLYDAAGAVIGVLQQYVQTFLSVLGGSEYWGECKFDI